jgi:hypothetical protein
MAAPTGINTNVTWTMSGESDFLSKAFCLAKGGMDKAIGPDFEKGPAQMKAAAAVTKSAPVSKRVSTREVPRGGGTSFRMLRARSRHRIPRRLPPWHDP